MRFATSTIFISLARIVLLLALLVSSFVRSEDSQPITVESQQSYEGACSKLVVAGNDQTNACGQSLVIVTMTNGSASITIQYGNQDLGLFGSAVNQNHYDIRGAVVGETDNLPLQGSCNHALTPNNTSAFVCNMKDEQGSSWKIQFTTSPD